MAFGEGGCASHPHAGELVSRTRSPLPKSGVTRRRWQGATTRNSWRYSEEEQRSQRRRDAPEFGDGLRVRDTGSFAAAICTLFRGPHRGRATSTSDVIPHLLTTFR